MSFEFAISFALYSMFACVVYALFVELIENTAPSAVDADRKFKTLARRGLYRVGIPAVIYAPYGEGFKSRFLLADPVYCGYGKYGNAYRGLLLVKTTEGQVYHYGMWTFNGHVLKAYKFNTNTLFGYEYVGRVDASVYDEVNERPIQDGWLQDPWFDNDEHLVTK